MANNSKRTQAPSPLGSSHSEQMAKDAKASAAYRKALEELAPAESLARLILHKRAELGLSQSELAERMGTTPSVISRLESGQHSITMKTLQRVAAALDTQLVVGFAEKEQLEVVAESSNTPELAVV